MAASCRAREHIALYTEAIRERRYLCQCRQRRVGHGGDQLHAVLVQFRQKRGERFDRGGMQSRFKQVFKLVDDEQRLRAAARRNHSIKAVADCGNGPSTGAEPAPPSSSCRQASIKARNILACSVPTSPLRSISWGRNRPQCRLSVRRRSRPAGRQRVRPMICRRRLVRAPGRRGVAPAEREVRAVSVSRPKKMDACSNREWFKAAEGFCKPGSGYGQAEPRQHFFQPVRG